MRLLQILLARFLNTQPNERTDSHPVTMPISTARTEKNQQSQLIRALSNQIGMRVVCEVHTLATVQDYLESPKVPKTAGHYTVK